MCSFASYTEGGNLVWQIAWESWSTWKPCAFLARGTCSTRRHGAIYRGIRSRLRCVKVHFLWKQTSISIALSNMLSLYSWLKSSVINIGYSWNDHKRNPGKKICFLVINFQVPIRGFWPRFCKLNPWAKRSLLFCWNELQRIFLIVFGAERDNGESCCWRITDRLLHIKGAMINSCRYFFCFFFYKLCLFYKEYMF